MSLLLVEALRTLRLRAGEVYRATVDGQTVEVRVADGDATATVAGEVMLDPWFEIPFETLGSVQASPGGVPLPDPPTIPNDEVES